MKTYLPTFVTFGILFTAAATTASARSALAADPVEVEDLPQITINDPNRDLFRLGLPSAIGDGDLVGQAVEIERRDLDLVGLFRLLDPASFPESLIKEGLGFSSDYW